MSLLAVRNPAVVESASPRPHALPQRFSPGLRSHAAAGVRRLRTADAAAFHSCRLEALTLDPCAFAASFDEEVGRGLADVATRLDKGATFGAFLNGVLVGTAGFATAPLQKKCHKGLLCGVYVRAAARGRGLGRLLVERVIDHARGRVDQLHATVVVSAHAARALYRHLGFRLYGLEPRGLKVGDQYFDQELLVLPLR